MFNVGDKIKVVELDHMFFGQEGTVVESKKSKVQVQLGSFKLNFNPSALQKVSKTA